MYSSKLRSYSLSFFLWCSEDESDEASEEDIEVEAEIDEKGRRGTITWLPMRPACMLPVMVGLHACCLSWLVCMHAACHDWSAWSACMLPVMVGLHACCLSWLVCMHAACHGRSACMLPVMQHVRLHHVRIRLQHATCSKEAIFKKNFSTQLKNISPILNQIQVHKH